MDGADNRASSELSPPLIPTRVIPDGDEEACLNGEARYDGRLFRINLSNLHQRANFVEIGGEYDIGLHTHSYYELNYIYDGHPTNEINGKPYPCAPGDLFLMNTHLSHRFVGENFYVVSITLSREDILSAMRYATRWETHRPFTPEESPILRFMQYNAADGKYSALEHSHLLFQAIPSAHSSGFRDWLRNCFDQYAVTIVELGPGWRFDLLAILSRIFAGIQGDRYFDCIDITETPSKSRQLYYDVLRLMEQTKGNITRRELSTALFFSENHIADVVREHCGMTIQQLKRTYLMEEAKHLLRDTALSIEEISDQVGFATKSGFYHSFKDYFGCTPAQYRAGTAHLAV